MSTSVLPSALVSLFGIVSALLLATDSFTVSDCESFPSSSRSSMLCSPAVGFALVSAVGFALVLPAVGYVLVLPAVGFALVLPADGNALLAVIVPVLLPSFFSPLTLGLWFRLCFLSPLALWLWCCLCSLSSGVAFSAVCEVWLYSVWEIRCRCGLSVVFNTTA